MLLLLYCILISSQPVAEPKAKPTMFQSGKTTFSKTAKVTAVHIPSGPALSKRQQELQKQVSDIYFPLHIKPDTIKVPFIGPPTKGLCSNCQHFKICFGG